MTSSVVPGESEDSGLAEAQRKLLLVLGVATFMVGEIFPAGRGTALSLFAFALFLGGGAGSVGMGCLLDRYGYQRGFALAGASFVLFAGYAWRVVRPRSGVDADVTGAVVLPARPSR